MAYIQWSKLEKRDNGGGGSNGDGIFLKFGPGKFRVRLLGEPYEYEQLFISKKNTTSERDIPVISPGDDSDPLRKMGYNATPKLAVNVLDRKDDNKLKIMRVGPSVYNHIKSYYEETGVDPSDPKKGPDLLISVDDPNGNPRQRKYTVTFLQATKITREEASKIKEEGGLHKLEKYFKAATTEEIEELISKFNISSVNGDASFDDDDDYSF
jgi:hypothetical protein